MQELSLLVLNAALIFISYRKLSDSFPQSNVESSRLLQFEEEGSNDTCAGTFLPK